MPTDTRNLVPVECLICADVCEALVVFRCGHYTCYICGLHIHAINSRACPVCREKGETVIVTRTLPDGKGEDDKFSTELLKTMEAESVFDKRLRCYINGEPLAYEIAKTYSYVCPLPKCWQKGEQDPFYEISFLQQHLKYDHKLEYCQICLDHRSVLLCEQQLYTREALQMHMDGVYPHDIPSFLGHPCCRFCKSKRFYGEDELLSHLTFSHFTCDVCNRDGFSFVYYSDRRKLLQHFSQKHKLCDHPDCVNLDPMMRVFASDLELAVHKHHVHGMRSRVTLFTAGDTNSLETAAAAGGGGGGGASPLPASSSPAVGTNVNVTRIVFDHVSRLETVDLMTRRLQTSENGQEQGGKKKWFKQKKGEEVEEADGVAAVPLPCGGSGLPKHFRSQNVLSPLMREKDVLDVAPSAGTHSTAFGISESAAAYNVKNNVPANRDELQAALDEFLRCEIRDMHQMNNFRACTAEFMSGKMLATKYYKCLRFELFPSEKVFNKIFPLLVATVPIPEKRDALVHIEKMQNSSEAQHAQRVQAEEAKRKAEEAKWKQHHEMATRLEQKSKKQNNKNGAVRNVWLEKGSAGIVSQQGSQTTASQQQQQQQQQQQPRREESSVWRNVNRTINTNNSGNDRSNNNNNNNSNNNNNNNNMATANNVNNITSNNNFSGGSNVRYFADATTNSTLSNAWGMSPQRQAAFRSTTTNYQEDFDNYPELPTINRRRGPRNVQSKQLQRSNAWHRR